MVEYFEAIFVLGQIDEQRARHTGVGVVRKLDDIRSFIAVLEDNHPQEAMWKFAFFGDEAHYSLVHQATYHGFKFLYDGWQISDEIASKAEFEDYEAHYDRLSQQYGYTIKIPMTAGDPSGQSAST